MLAHFLLLLCGLFAGVIMGDFLNDVFLSSYVSNRKNLYCLLNSSVYIYLILEKGINVKTLIYCLVASILLMISIIDYHFYEIPVKFNYYLLILGIVYSCIDYKNWLGHVAGFFCVSSFLCALLLVSNGKLMGGGDVKLMAACGFVLGCRKIFIAFYLGCVLTVIIYYFCPSKGKKGRIVAMGPYFTAGILLVLLYN